MLRALAPPGQLDAYGLCARIFGWPGCRNRDGAACAAGAAPQPFADAACEHGGDADSDVAALDAPCCSGFACGSDMLEVRMT